MVEEYNERRVAKYTMAVAVMLTGLEAHRIRRFECYQLIRPARTKSRQRLYSDMDIELVREIAQLERKGVNMRGIRIILEIKRGEDYRMCPPEGGEEWIEE